MILQKIKRWLKRAKNTLHVHDDGFHPFDRPTGSGINVSETFALQYAAVFCATRIISETVATFPLNLMQKTGREKHIVEDDDRHQLLHSEPNPEQDSFVFFDQMLPNQINSGNAYAEIQRGTGGKIEALWPIHPSRIKIKRGNDFSNRSLPIGIGQEDIVYLHTEPSGGQRMIARSNMLHVPGVLSPDGISGRGIVEWGAQSIGISLATEMHAGAFFRNGTNSNFVVTLPTKPDDIPEMKREWAKVHGGSQNAYETIFLWGGIDVKTLSLSPEASQLLGTRQFNVNDIARWYRLPPHMLADLTRSSFSNIESENLSFVVHSMMPWITRWERALNRQLLTREERQAGMFWKFNVNSLLRGDTKARTEFYTKMFSVGALSPNMILELEDQNPVEGGDEHFVQVNLIPLARADEFADKLIEGGTVQTPDEPDENTGHEDEDDDTFHEDDDVTGSLHEDDPPITGSVIIPPAGPLVSLNNDDVAGNGRLKRD